MSHTIQIDTFKHLTFFSDARTSQKDAIEHFLESGVEERLADALPTPTYIVLWGDGLFVEIAKKAHHDQIPILGVNFGTKGFLLHDRAVFERKTVFSFSERAYPILHILCEIGEERIEWYAFNEVFLVRSGDAQAIDLFFAHEEKYFNYRGDGIMVSTPTGSTGWSRSYGWVILPHEANLNVITPVGGITPNTFSATVFPDSGTIHIQYKAARENSIDLLIDNTRMLHAENRPFFLTITRASENVTLLIEDSYASKWDGKIYEEQGMSLEKI